MAKKYLNNAVRLIYENAHGCNKHYIQANSDS